jgi:hypothetical protein
MKPWGMIAILAALSLATDAQQPVDPSAQHAKQLLSRAIQALGGKVYLSARTVRQQGRWYSFHQGNPKDAGNPFVRYVEFPDKERVDFYEKYEKFKTAKWSVIHDGDAGYEVTFRGACLEDESQNDLYRHQRHYSLDQLLKSWLSDASTALLYDGPSIVGAREAEVVELINHDRKAKLSLDGHTMLPIQSEYSWRDEKTKQVDTAQEQYDQYRVVDGIATPFKITRWRNGMMVNQQFLNEVSYEADLDDSLFVPPGNAQQLSKVRRFQLSN